MGKNDQIFYVGLKAFIADKEKLLIVQDQESEQWELPGGKIQTGENTSYALQRELKEEIGEIAQVKPGPVFYVWTRQPYPEQNFYLFLVGFQCTWNGGEISLSPEHKNFRWITKEEVDGIDFENTYKDAIKQYFQTIEK